MSERSNDRRDDNVTLIPLICPGCGKFVTSIVARGGPVLVRHSTRYQREMGIGSWVTCKARWVVVPDPDARKLRLRKVSGLNQPDLVLREEADLWQRTT